MRSRALLPLAGALLWGVAAFGIVHGTLWTLASHAEVAWGAYSWPAEEYLQVLIPSNYEGRGEGRLLCYGPSESREGFLIEVLEPALPQYRVYQNSQSVGTLDDLEVLLDYLERSYGKDALPEAVLLGVTTRFVANILMAENGPTPLFDAIDRFGPRFRVDRSSDPPRLVEKGPIEGLLARLRFLPKQTIRYKSALRAVRRELAILRDPARENDWGLLRPLLPYKYHGWSRRPEEITREWLVDPEGFWWDVHRWDPESDRERILAQVGRIARLCEAKGIRLYVVNMPELSWNRELYPAGRYESYLEILREALGETPFLDLRTLLPAEEFFDSGHPTREGAIEISRRVAQFVRAHEPERSRGRTGDG